ncbi:MAG: Gfo/Idh/MocA family oxidoreductase [Rhodospirillales bacterium]|nr:Gfo/Idh/MocA family oxidoreductase [Rhodospirillales bacterium]
MKRRVNLALIGHRFMGKAHSHALHDLPFFFDLEVEPVRRLLCGIGDDLEETAARYGWQTHGSRWQDAVSDPEIDVVAIATPGNTHCEIAVAAARAGKHVICEKPLALDAAEAERMCRAADAAGVKHLVNFNYRRVPAVALAKQIIEDGRLGEIYYFRATYWQDWPLDPAFPFLWRMDKAVAGAGSMADKGSHLVDLARFLVGEFAEVAAATRTFVNERPAGNGVRAVTTDDAAAFVARFENGALGLFGTSRMSAGHRNSLGFEVNGSRGSLIFDLERLNELQVYFGSDSAETQGFRAVMATQPEHRYMKSWWPPGHVIGWEHTFVHQYYEFLKAIAEDGKPSPDFSDGLRAQRVLDAVAAAADGRRWVKIADDETFG